MVQLVNDSMAKNGYWDWFGINHGGSDGLIATVGTYMVRTLVTSEWCIMIIIVWLAMVKDVNFVTEQV